MPSVPEGWERVLLEDVSNKIMVGIASSATHAYRYEGVILLRNLNIKEGYIDTSDLLFIDEEYEMSHKNKRLKTGDVVTVRTGYPGVSAVIDSRFEDAQCFTSLITRPNPDKLNSRFLCEYINSPTGKGFILGAEAGGAQKNVNAGSLEKMPLLLPHLPEQIKIASILSQWDDSLSILTKLLTAKRQQKRGLAEQLLTGKRRLPGFDGEWEEKKLGDFFVEVSERNNSNRSLIVLSCSKVYGIVPQTQIFKKRVASEDIRRYKVLQKGDLVYDPMLLWDASIGFLEVIDEGSISPAYNTFRLTSGEREFFKFIFKTHRFWQIYNDISQGTNVRRRKADSADLTA